MSESPSPARDPQIVPSLLAEYTSLRTESTHRTNNLFQLAAVVAVLVGWTATRDSRLALIPSLAVLAFSLWALISLWCLIRDILWAVRRLRFIENEVNKRLGVTVLGWETESSWRKKYLGLTLPNW
jgi:hypothetical protein